MGLNPKFTTYSFCSEGVNVYNIAKAGRLAINLNSKSLQLDPKLPYWKCQFKVRYMSNREMRSHDSSTV